MSEEQTERFLPPLKGVKVTLNQHLKNIFAPYDKRRRILFIDKRIWLPSNPRKGICHKCGKTGITDFHHDLYEINDPTKNTRELCPSCHAIYHKFGLINIGRHRSEETKEKLRIANIGKHHSKESKMKISEFNKGKHLTLEHKMKIGLSKTGPRNPHYKHGKYAKAWKRFLANGKDLSEALEQLHAADQELRSHYLIEKTGE